ncbi:arginine ABC transporter permease protein ArtQ [Shewanella sp. NFH-SH190041]|uniref:arginine ABC transporter permease ArtQ n=1 Tax=Shewanella sp. NFH-SH190041 TaxID=2950245 RepID=UPI0021C3CED5|nr:arginine ABC transporter permease ArtQ [Shewanella sp. NFH-SH190041]BDM64863.1 arginine ABC transporter permease protein ArtQ [Shewanella sp. NFH-SH190041]
MTDFLLLLLSASTLTIGLAVTSALVGLVMAIVLALLESTPVRWISMLTRGYILIMRGLPELLIVLLVYFGSSHVLFLLTGQFVEISAFFCGVLALSSIFAVYVSQILRGALLAIPKGQWEAGLALGMGRLGIFFRLLLPQVWRHALPAMGNQWLVLLKDTALVSLIGVNDLMKQTQIIASSTWEPFTWFSCAALIYLLITLISQYGLKRMNWYVTRHERGEA